MARLFLLLVGLCVSFSLWALRDPTQPADVDASSYGSGYNISLIIVSDTRKMAVLNGLFVSEGDTVGQDKVIEIKPDSVVLQDETTGVRIDAPLINVNIRPQHEEK